MNKLVKEFKDFIARGNMMDMAIGIIIGSAFSAIVASLINDIFMPIVGIVFGEPSFANVYIKIFSGYILVGNFIQTVVNFLVLAVVAFVLIKVITMLRRKKEDDPVEPSNEEKLLTEIRDLLKK